LFVADVITIILFIVSYNKKYKILKT